MGMSYAPVNIEITDKLIKSRDRVGLVVLMSIANRCSPTGLTDIGVYRLSEVSGYSRETVQNKLIEFQNWEWIKIRLISDEELRRKRYRTQVSPEVIYIRHDLIHEAIALWQRPSEIVMFGADSVTKDRQPDSGLTRWLKPESKPEKNQNKTSVPTRNAQEKSAESAHEITIFGYDKDYDTAETGTLSNDQITIFSYNDSYKPSASQIATLPAAQLDPSAQQPPPVPARPPHIEALVLDIKRAAPTLSEKLIHELIERHGAGIVQNAYQTMIGTKNVRNPAAYLRSLITKKSGSNKPFNPLEGGYLSREAILGK